MRLFITTANELRLMYIISRTEVMLLITSVRANIKFLVVFSTHMVPTVGNATLIIHINNEPVILPDRIRE